MSLAIDLKHIIDQLNKKILTDGDWEEASCVQMMADFLHFRLQYRALCKANGEDHPEKIQWYVDNSPHEMIRNRAAEFLEKNRKVRMLAPDAGNQPESPDAVPHEVH